MSKISVVVILLIMTMVSSNLNWGKDRWKDIIESDAKGNYAYLPAIFIYHDLNLGFFEKIEKVDYYNENLFYDYRSSANGKVINKYYCGTAIAELPFFMAAHSLSYILDYKADGYSKLYHVFINIAALFYLAIGLIFLNSTLSVYRIKEWIKSLILFAAVFGTNLFYYVACEPGMSHVYSFAFITMFYYYSTRYFSSLQPGEILKLGLILGLIILIRPINGLVLLILPAAAGNFQSLKNGVRAAFRNYLWLSSGVLLMVGMLSIQLVIYKISAGEFFVYAYGGEGFNFLDPHVIDMLFSYKKGLFLYTPLYLLALTGGYFLWKSSRFQFYSLFCFLAMITYVFSSWWMWYYGGSFSSRVYVDYLAMFMILLAMAVNSIRVVRLKKMFVGMIIVLTLLCQVQTYQYRYYQIHWSDMTSEKYWDVFLRIDKLIK
jgi:hypothetical protein